jgi:hypothetical protein
MIYETDVKAGGYAKPFWILPVKYSFSGELSEFQTVQLSWFSTQPLRQLFSTLHLPSVETILLITECHRHLVAVKNRDLL